MQFAIDLQRPLIFSQFIVAQHAPVAYEFLLHEIRQKLRLESSWMERTVSDRDMHGGGVRKPAAIACRRAGKTTHSNPRCSLDRDRFVDHLLMVIANHGLGCRCNRANYLTVLDDLDRFQRRIAQHGGFDTDGRGRIVHERRPGRFAVEQWRAASDRW